MHPAINGGIFSWINSGSAVEESMEGWFNFMYKPTRMQNSPMKGPMKEESIMALLLSLYVFPVISAEV